MADEDRDGGQSWVRADDRNIGEQPWVGVGPAQQRRPERGSPREVLRQPTWTYNEWVQHNWQRMAESGQVFQEGGHSFFPTSDPRSTSMSLDPMLYQAYTNDPDGFMQNVLPLLTQNQQGQFQQVVRRQVEVRNAEGAFGGGNTTTQGGRTPDAGAGPGGQNAGSAPPSLAEKSRPVVGEAVKRRDERQAFVGQNPTFAPREITPPTMPAQTTTGAPVTPTNTPTVTLTPTTPDNVKGGAIKSPALAIQDNLAGRRGMGWAPTDAVVANTPISGTGETQTIGLSDFAVKQGTSNIAPYDPGVSAPAPVKTNAAPSVTTTNTNPSFAGLTVGQRGYAQGLVASGHQGPIDEVAINRYIQSGGVQKFDGGGMINEPIVGQGQFTGATYTFAERGKERVMPEGPYRTEIKLRSGHRISVGGSD